MLFAGYFNVSNGYLVLTSGYLIVSTGYSSLLLATSGSSGYFCYFVLATTSRNTYSLVSDVGVEECMSFYVNFKIPYKHFLISLSFTNLFFIFLMKLNSNYTAIPYALVEVWTSEAALQRCSYKKVFWKYAANIQENIHGKVWFQYSYLATLLKSPISMGVLL